MTRASFIEAVNEITGRQYALQHQGQWDAARALQRDKRLLADKLPESDRAWAHAALTEQ